MVLSDLTVPGDLGRHFPTISSQQRTYRFVTDDIDRLVAVTDLSAGPAVGADFTLLNAGLTGDPCPRVLTATIVNANSGDSRGIVIDVYGITEMGPRRERLDFGTQALNTSWHMFTRNAFRVVTRVVYVSRNGGAVASNDTVRLGAVHASGTLVGTLVTTNGAAAGRYKGVGLPVPVTGGTDNVGAASADFQSEILGCFVAEDGTSGVSTNTILSRGNEFLVDNGYSVLVPDEEFAATAGNIALEIWVASRLRL